MLPEVFGERVISQGLWPACSPDLNPSDLFMERTTMYNPHSLQELKENILQEASIIPRH
jgi:hypothetical protein